METKDSKLHDLLDTLDTFTLNGPTGYSDYNYGAVPPITMNDTLSSISATSISITPTTGTGGTYSNTVLTTNGTGGVNWSNSPYTISTGSGLYNTMPSGQIQLNGENADIKINDWSLKEAVQRIEERLNLLTPNPGLEKDWDELKALGEQYRKLEQHIKDKMATWEKLKAMPPPVID